MTKCKDCNKEHPLNLVFTFVDKDDKKFLDTLCNSCKPFYFMVNNIMYTFEQFKNLRVKEWKHNDVKSKYPNHHGEQVIHSEAGFVGTIFSGDVLDNL